MKRIGVLLLLGAFGILGAGCTGGGLEEGTAKDTTTQSAQPSGLQEEMKRNAAKMQLKGGRPKNVPPAGKSGS
jgi:hypothetical protein